MNEVEIARYVGATFAREVQPLLAEAYALAVAKHK